MIAEEVRTVRTACFDGVLGNSGHGRLQPWGLERQGHRARSLLRIKSAARVSGFADPWATLSCASAACLRPPGARDSSGWPPAGDLSQTGS